MEGSLEVSAAKRQRLSAAAHSSADDGRRQHQSGTELDSSRGGRIHTMGSQLVQRICSDQVIVDLQSAVKELLENALDANATRIDIRLKDHGVELLEVADNGSGISSGNLPGIALRHHTSKLSQFDDLQKLRSFGFRGEALSSLSSLATLSLSTRTKDDTAGTTLTFSADGAITSRVIAAREVGTCVSVAQLFAPFPVRRRELQRNALSEFRKMLVLLQAYAIICDHVRFNCVNTPTKGGKQVLIQTQGGSDGMRAAIASVFGAKQLSELRQLSAADGDVAISGFISRPRAGDGRRGGDRQYIYVNRRPVDFPKLTRLLNETFRAATAKSECFPVAFLHVQVPIPLAACLYLLLPMNLVRLSLFHQRMLVSCNVGRHHQKAMILM